MPFSPRTMNFMTPPMQEPEQLFEQAFADKAMQAFYRKFPELSEHIVHFKIIDSNAEENRAVGAIILQLNDVLLVVPVFYSSGNVKPLLLLYAPRTKRFAPATQEWIQELLQRNLVELGKGVDIPQNLQADQDIRPLVVPPRIGRYSFASARSSLLEFLNAASPLVKKAFSLILQKNKKILKFAFEHYNKEALLDALRPRLEKKAEVPKGDLQILTPGTDITKFRQLFGKDTQDAWNLAMNLGYVIKDDRTNTGTAVSLERPIYMTAAKSNTLVRVFLDNGDSKEALVISFPIGLAPQHLYANKTRNTNRAGVIEYVDPYALRKRVTEDKQRPVIIYTEDGEIYLSKIPPLGEVIHDINKDTRIYKTIAQNIGQEPKAGNVGVFVHFEANHIDSTPPVEIAQVTYTKKGNETIRTIKAHLHSLQGPSSVIIISSTKAPNARLRLVIGENNKLVWYLPFDYEFLKCNALYSEEKSKILTGAHGKSLDKTAVYKQKLAAFLPLIKIEGHGNTFVVNKAPNVFDKVGCIKYIATKYNINGIDVAECVEKAASKGFYEFFAAPSTQKTAALLKSAQMPPMAMPPPMAEGMPPETMAMPPPMAEGMPPETMAGPSPTNAEMSPGVMMGTMPSPVEIAANELEQQLLAEAQQTEQQIAEHQKDVAEKLQLIQAIKQRAQEILTGRPATPEEGAAQAEPIIEQAVESGDKGLFEAAALGSLALLQQPISIIAEFLPQIEDAVNALAKIIIVMWLKESELKQNIGDLKYDDLEQRLKNLFESLGGLLLQLNYLVSLLGNEEPSPQI